MNNKTADFESVLVIRDPNSEILIIEVNDMKKRTVRTYKVVELGLDDKKDFYTEMIGAPIIGTGLLGLGAVASSAKKVV